MKELIGTVLFFRNRAGEQTSCTTRRQKYYSHRKDPVTINSPVVYGAKPGYVVV